MKDQYVADVNDYVKYSILRAIQEAHAASLFVCWMLTADDHRNDGAKISYLREPARYRPADPELFDALKRLVASGDRSTRSIEELGILPGATFFRRRLGDGKSARATYMAELRNCLEGHDVVFFDPDNGLSVGSVPVGRAGSGRYIDCSELAVLKELQAAAVVYQHFPRVPRRAYVLDQLKRLSEALPGYSTLAIYSSHVAFLAAAPEDHRAGVESAFHLAIGRWRNALNFVAGETESGHASIPRPPTP